MREGCWEGEGLQTQAGSAAHLSCGSSLGPFPAQGNEGCFPRGSQVGSGDPDKPAETGHTDGHFPEEIIQLSLDSQEDCDRQKH